MIVNGTDDLLIPMDPDIYMDAPSEFIFHELGLVKYFIFMIYQKKFN